MNGPHTPAFSRNNRWTQLIERVGQQNAMDGKPAGRMVEQMANTTPLLSARRGVDKRGLAVGKDFIPEMDDPRAAMMANARAAALGISNDAVPRDDDMPGDIGHVSSDPSDAEIDAMLAAARGQVPGASVGGEGAAAPGVPSAPAAAGRVALPHGIAPPVGLAGPRTMPNFANVEGFDLARKVVVVDGMEFKIADDDVVNMKKFAIQIVLDNVTYQLAQALIQLGIPQDMANATAEKMRETAAGATGGVSGTEEMREVSQGETTGGVSSGPTGDGHAVVEVQGLRLESQSISKPSNSESAVQSNSQGSSSPSADTGRENRPSDDTDYLLADGGNITT